MDIRDEVYKRIVLAKSLLNAGESACASINDQMTFTKGILLLHDAAEAALGAIADQLHAKLKDKHYILDYYSLINENDEEKRSVPFQTQIRNLNTLRINAKHQGMLPDPRSNSHLPGMVRELISELCNNYLKLDFSSISLKSLITDSKIRSYIDVAEKKMDDSNIEAALINLAFAVYHICEIGIVSFRPFSPIDERFQFRFPQYTQLRHIVELLEYGVDPYLYFRFKNLTPNIAVQKVTGELFFRWDKHYGHEENWTIRNARFCLDFCINTALKFQRPEDEGYTLVQYMDIYEDLIEPVNDKAIFWGQSIHPKDLVSVKSAEARKQVFVLNRGEKIVGYAYDSEDSLDEWFVLGSDIKNKLEKNDNIGFAYVMKEEVSVTQRKKRKSE